MFLCVCVCVVVCMSVSVCDEESTVVECMHEVHRYFCVTCVLCVCILYCSLTVILEHCCWSPPPSAPVLQGVFSEAG